MPNPSNSKSSKEFHAELYQKKQIDMAESIIANGFYLLPLKAHAVQISPLVLLNASSTSYKA
jgi:hypothetical protein